MEFSGTTGVDSHIEVAKFLLAGADAVATTSSLLRHGVAHMTTLVDGLTRWVAQSGYGSVAEIRGALDGTHVSRADVYLRTQYLRTISDYMVHHSAAFDGHARRTNLHAG